MRCMRPIGRPCSRSAWRVTGRLYVVFERSSWSATPRSSPVISTRPALDARVRRKAPPAATRSVPCDVPAKDLVAPDAGSSRLVTSTPATMPGGAGADEGAEHRGGERLVRRRRGAAASAARWPRRRVAPTAAAMTSTGDEAAGVGGRLIGSPAGRDADDPVLEPDLEIPLRAGAAGRTSSHGR